jgi:hypothetical protein
MRKITGLGILAMLFAVVGCDKADFKGAEAEVKKIEANLDLPPVPAFDVPAPQGTTHSPRELRLVGQKLLGTDLEVKGFVTYKYNCLTDGGMKGPVGGLEADQKTRENLIATVPNEWCYKPHMILNDTADGNPKVGLLVTFDEFDHIFKKLRDKPVKKLTKEEEAAKAQVDAYAVGQELTLSGKFTQQSPLGFGESRGLFILKAPENLEQPPAGSVLP